jgi:hypothetical protein
MSSGVPTEPPSAARLTARMPQVGARAHEIGWIQPGSSESGISIPVIIQTGYSSICENALASR